MKTLETRHALVVAVAIGALPCASHAAPVNVRMPEAFGGMQAEAVDDAALAGITGKYYGANMLVGVRVDLVSQWRGADGAELSARASVEIQRDAGGSYQVRIGTASWLALPPPPKETEKLAGAADATLATAPTSTSTSTNTSTSTPEVKPPPPPAPVASSTPLHVAGVSQLAQIAGDDNRVGNLATIGVVSNLSGAADFNGRASSLAMSGGYEARVSFVGGGLQMRLLSPEGTVSQQMGALGSDGGVAQAVSIAGNGQVAHNQMAMQVQIAPMSSALQQQVGVQQALAGLLALRR